MNEPDILYPAIFVFSMLLIGLLLTLWEFHRLQKHATTGRDNPVTGRRPEKTGNTVANVSGL